ncbi:MAG: alpha/beta hydrolase [Spirochaetales bacterium]|jgi:branched-chain amino acid transport system permease protein
MTSAFILIGGLQLFYTMAGSGQPLVYIHGNTGSSTWFSRVMEMPGYQTFALDLPNFGRSSPLPDEADLHVYADYVKKFIEAMHLESPIVVGHSLGGAVAQSLVLRYPGTAAALVLVDSSSPKGLLTPRERYPLIEMMRKDKGILSKALAATVPTLKDQAFFKSLVDEATLMSEKAWIGNAEALSHFDVSASTSLFKEPVLVIWGKEDFIVSEEMARETAKAFPGAELQIVENVGHSIIVESPELFVDIATAFLGKIEKK